MITDAQKSELKEASYDIGWFQTYPIPSNGYWVWLDRKEAGSKGYNYPTEDDAWDAAWADFQSKLR